MNEEQARELEHARGCAALLASMLATIAQKEYTDKNLLELPFDLGRVGMYLDEVGRMATHLVADVLGYENVERALKHMEYRQSGREGKN